MKIQGERPINRDRRFIFMREFARLHYKLGELSFTSYELILDLLNREEERLTLESEE